MADNKRVNPRRPIPANHYDKLRENLTSGFAEGFPVDVEGKTFGGFPAPDVRDSTFRGASRAESINRKNDKVKDISVGLQDHDEAVMYYFNEVIKPSVIVNGNRTPVPVIYGSPERWKSVQKDGYFRDKEGKLQVPLIMFKRDSVEKRRDLGNKLDGNIPRLHYTFEERYSRKNQYDNFSVLQGRKPVKERYAVAIPDYVKLNYTCTIWCDYVAQMNKLIESINFTSDSYWGDPDKWKFNARIDTYSNITEIQQGDNRIVKTNFGLNLQGYLIPDSINKELINGNLKKTLTKAQVMFKPEIIVTPTAEPLTRAEVRSQKLAEKVEQHGTGIGYQEIGKTQIKK